MINTLIMTIMLIMIMMIRMIIIIMIIIIRSYGEPGLRTTRFRVRVPRSTNPRTKTRNTNLEALNARLQ